MQGRPYPGSQDFNCLIFQGSYVSYNSSSSVLVDGRVGDAECSSTLCTACLVDSPMR